MSGLYMPRDSKLECSVFSGIGDISREGAGYFSKAHNISSRAYPRAVSALQRRQFCDLPDGDIYPFAGDKIGWLCSDGTLYYGGEQITDWDCGDSEADVHHTAMLGTKAVFFPNKAWFDTESGEFGSLEISKSSSDGTATASVYFDDGVYPSAMYYSLSEPTEPENNTLWVRKDFSDDSFTVYRRYSVTEEWVRQDKLIYRIFFDFAGVGISAGERLEVTACATEDTNIEGFLGQHRVYSVSHSTLLLESAPERKLLPRICRKTSHSVVLTSFTIERRIPDLSMICTAGERIWGIDADGSTLRACAPGDPFSWYSFDGYGGDSYELETAYPGAYTGICALGDMPVLFKSDRIIRVQGSRPDNYSLHSVSAVGLSPDSPDGAARDGESLFYKGNDGYIYRWNSSNPERISPFALSGCVAACSDGRFCVFGDSERFTFYDGKNGVFYTEDGSSQRLFSYGGAVWYIQDGKLCRIGDGADAGLGEGTLTDVGEWTIESSFFVPSDEYGASPRMLALDIESDGSSTVRLDFGWDGRFENVAGFCFRGRLRREVALPLRRCSSCAYRISGRGYFVLRGLTLSTPRG